MSEIKPESQPAMPALGRLSLLICSLFCVACSQPLAVSVNEQAVYDPRGRLPAASELQANLQGCINVALSTLDLERADQLTALSCPDSDISDLSNIGAMGRLRFLDLSNNRITNITPLEDLPMLSAVNLSNNRISNLGPLFNIPTLSTVDLSGNEQLPCDQLQTLRARLGSNLTAPQQCRR